MDDLSKSLLPRTVAFLVMLALLIFVPALSIAYWQGWAYWLIFCAATLLSSRYFLKHDPALVRRRMHVGARAETEPVQKIIMALNSVLLSALFVVSAIDHGRQWSSVPWFVSVFALAVMVHGYALIFLTLKTNTFAASTIQVERGQRVVSSGPYAFVRHPMYSGAILMFLATPLALGSLWGLVPAFLLVIAIAARLLHEEHVLSRELQDYDAYRARVRARLIPGIW